MAIDNPSYHDIIMGQDEPDAIWGRGDSIIEMCHKLGDYDPRDIDNNPIDPGLSYMLTKKGIYRLCL